MKIILSPAKKMRSDPDSLPVWSSPVYLEKARTLLSFLKSLSPEQLQKLWACNDSIARQNTERLQHMDLTHNLTPAILAYEGIAFQYMAPSVFEDAHFQYVQEHLRILSGLYGVLRPMDGVQPYRLEMQAKVQAGSCKNLYEFWGDDLYRQVKGGVILNLASKEYSQCIEKYLGPEDTFITCVFGETVNGKLVQKGTFAKMARGEMVRFLAEQQAENPEEAKNFHRLGYRFRRELSSDREYIFERIPQ